GMQRVPNRLGLQPASREMREQTVLRVLLPRGRSGDALHLIGVREHDAPMKVAEAPAVGDEIARQPVEQLRVGWWIALLSEIVRRAHQAVAEMPTPNPIDDDARGERIFRTGQPLGESGATAVRRTGGGKTGDSKHGWETWRDDFERLT